MSWDVELENAGPVGRFEDGGTHVMGGTTHPELNITYNYGQCFRLVWPKELNGPNALGQMLDGKQAKDTIADLEIAVEKLGTRGYDDYWAPTPGNAGAALARLLEWAKQYPDGTWRVS